MTINHIVLLDLPSHLVLYHDLVTDAHLLANPKNHQHIALVYDGVDELNARIAEYLNEGLRRGQLCVYATIHFRDQGHIDKFAALIADYKENSDKGNLLVVDLAPFYISALLGDMKPFEDAKKIFAEKAKDKEDKHVRFAGDATGFLFKNKHFDECAMIEQWWQRKPFEGSHVCPFPKSFLNSFPHEIYSKRSVFGAHDTLMDICGDYLIPDKVNGDVPTIE